MAISINISYPSTEFVLPKSLKSKVEEAIANVFNRIFTCDMILQARSNLEPLGIRSHLRAFQVKPNGYACKRNSWLTLIVGIGGQQAVDVWVNIPETLTEDRFWLRDQIAIITGSKRSGTKVVEKAPENVAALRRLGQIRKRAQTLVDQLNRLSVVAQLLINETDHLMVDLQKP